MQSFRAKLEPVPHGGHYVAVPAGVAEAAGLRHAARVRGTVNGAPYRSSLMMYSGVFHLGVHRATLAAAGAKPPARVTVTIELDDEPLPTDTVPEDASRKFSFLCEADEGHVETSFPFYASARCIDRRCRGVLESVDGKLSAQ